LSEELAQTKNPQKSRAVLRVSRSARYLDPELSPKFSIADYKIVSRGGDSLCPFGRGGKGSRTPRPMSDNSGSAPRYPPRQINYNIFFIMEDLLYDLFQAYFDARENKRNTNNALAFEIDYETKLFELYRDIVSKNYKISPSICFVTFKPL